MNALQSDVKEAVPVAYDYDRQCWVEGDEARMLREKQLKLTLSVLESERGVDYVRFTDGVGGEFERQVAVKRLRAMLVGNGGGK